jgi:hypothetical protein
LWLGLICIASSRVQIGQKVLNRKTKFRIVRDAERGLGIKIVSHAICFAIHRAICDAIVGPGRRPVGARRFVCFRNLRYRAGESIMKLTQRFCRERQNLLDAAGEMRCQVWMLQHQLRHGVTHQAEHDNFVLNHGAIEMAGVNEHRHVVQRHARLKF